MFDFVTGQLSPDAPAPSPRYLVHFTLLGVALTLIPLAWTAPAWLAAAVLLPGGLVAAALSRWTDSPVGGVLYMAVTLAAVMLEYEGVARGLHIWGLVGLGWLVGWAVARRWVTVARFAKAPIVEPNDRAADSA